MHTEHGSIRGLQIVNIPDNYSQWLDHERQLDKQLAQLPVCADCGHHIQDDHYYLINDKAICPECLESGYRKEVDCFDE